MSARYFIQNGQSINPVMPMDWDGCLVSFLFYGPTGLPVSVTGLPAVSRSLYEVGDIFNPVQPFAVGEWRFNGPSARVKVSLAGVTGFTTYRVLIWRTGEPLPMVPDGAFTGLRAMTVQTYDESNKKLGSQWEASRLVSIASNAPANNAYSIIRTVALPVDLKSRVLGYDEVGVIGRIYKNPVYTGGANDTWFNMRPSLLASQPQAQLLVGFTLTSVGTKCGADIVGIGPNSTQSRGSTPIQFGSNRILDEPNTSYLLEIASRHTGAQNVWARLEIHEGGLDLPIAPQ